MGGDRDDAHVRVLDVPFLAMKGLGEAWMRSTKATIASCNRSCRGTSVMSSVPGNAKCPASRSSPEQKPRPSPVSTTTRQERSALTSSIAACRPSIMS